MKDGKKPVLAPSSRIPHLFNYQILIEPREASENGKSPSIL